MEPDIDGIVLLDETTQLIITRQDIIILRPLGAYILLIIIGLCMWKKLERFPVVERLVATIFWSCVLMGFLLIVLRLLLAIGYKIYFGL